MCVCVFQDNTDTIMLLSFGIKISGLREKQQIQSQIR